MPHLVKSAEYLAYCKHLDSSELSLAPRSSTASDEKQPSSLASASSPSSFSSPLCSQKASGDTIGVISQSWGSAAAAMVYVYQFTFCSTTLAICWSTPRRSGHMESGPEVTPLGFWAGIWAQALLQRWVSPYGTSKWLHIMR